MGQEIEEIVANEENEEILGYELSVVDGRVGEEIEEIVANKENEEIMTNV